MAVVIAGFRSSSDLARFAPVAVFAGSFLVYFLTLAPTVFRLDSAELTTVAYNLGVPHATGYPLYLVIGKLFTYVPVGDVGYRVNLMSAVFGAGTVTIVYLLAYLVSGRVALSLAAAGFSAFSYYLWTSSVVAEVYTLHAFLTATTIYLLLQWNRTGDHRWLYAAGFAWGLSFGNHLSTVLLGPGFAYLMAVNLWRGRLRVRYLIILAVCFAPALAIYAYLPLRYLAEAVPYVLGQYDDQGVLIRVDHTTFQGMWQTLTARQFGGLFFYYGPVEYLGQLWQACLWLFGNFLGIGLVLGGLGIVSSYAPMHRERLIFLGLIFGFNLLFFVSYGADDKESMFLPVYLIWSVWVAEGCHYFLEMVERPHPAVATGKSIARLYRALTGLPWEKLALMLPLAALTINFSYANARPDTFIRDQSEQVLAAFEPNALVLARWPDEAPMTYLQIVEDHRPDVQIIDRFLILREDETRLIERNLSVRPVYVFGPLPALSLPYKKVPIDGGIEAGHRLLPIRQDEQYIRNVVPSVQGGRSEN